MLQYIFRRLLQAIPTLIGISIISFVLTSFVPGGPLLKCRFNPKNPKEVCDLLEKQLGLDQPLAAQYLRWLTGYGVRLGDMAQELTLGNTTCSYKSTLHLTLCSDGGGGIIRGDLGISFNTNEPVWDRLVERMPATLELGFASLCLSLFVGIPLGVLSAAFRGSFFDNMTRGFTALAQSVPIFWLCLLFILVFAVVLNILPSGGRSTPSLDNSIDLGDRIRHLILPSVTLAIGGIAAFARIMRTETLEVIGLDYVRTAKAKGLSDRTIWFRHALRNALIPLMTILGPAIVGILSGAIVIETIFAWPGMGRLTLNAVSQKDFPMVLGSGMFFAMLTIIGNLLSDIFYAVVDPRVRLS